MPPREGSFSASFDEHVNMPPLKLHESFSFNTKQQQQQQQQPAVVKKAHHHDVAPTAAQDPSGSPTPAWMIKAGKFISVQNFALPTLHGVILPFVVLGAQYHFNCWLSYREFLWTILFGYFKLIVTFTVFHRFFSHRTFSASRPVTFLLGLVALTGGQKGPLWWATKHVRHHKFCENIGDPHSVERFGWFYGYVGWIMHPAEWQIDWQYLHAPFKTWEMVLCEFLAPYVSFGEQYAWYMAFGLKGGLGNYWATIIAIYVTLFFNVALHHDDEIDPQPMPETGRYRCRAHNNVPESLKWFLDLIGEMDHMDHHKWPRKALHPAYLVDVPYWFLIYPGEQLGLFVDVNHDGKQFFGRNRRL